MTMLLTDEKIKDIANETLFNLLPADELILFARAIEAAVLEAQGKHSHKLKQVNKEK